MAVDEPKKAGSARPDRQDLSDDEADDAVDHIVLARFPPEEEASLIAEAHGHKKDANELFGHGRFHDALNAYDLAVSTLPPYCFYELAVLRSNMAACHLKMSAWKEAVDSATDAVTALDRDLEEAASKKKSAVDAAAAAAAAADESDEPAEEEIVSAGAKAAGQPSAPPSPSSEPTAEDRNRIRAKALLRRARARVELAGWANLAGAEEDYRALAALPDGTLGAADRRLAAQQLRTLPARTSAAKEEEMGEMMGKLKELGNGLLRPFGISTDNFQMVKDDKTGGYSMNFQPSGG